MTDLSQMLNRIDAAKDDLARNGCLCRCAERTVISYRRDGELQTRMIYVGNDPAAIAVAREALDSIQKPMREQRQARQVWEQHRSLRRKLKSLTRDLVQKNYALFLKGTELRPLSLNSK